MRIILCTALFAAALFLQGCVGVANLGPGGAVPGLIYSEVEYPNTLNPNMEYQIRFEREDVELLGPVSAESSSSNWFGVVGLGDSGYGALMDQVREMGGDGVMNVTVDTDYETIFIFYSHITTRLTGQAFKYKRAGS